MELTIEQAMQQGMAAHKEGKLQDAERLYRAILQSQPLHPDANHNLGVLAVSVNKADAALPLFKTALEANPKIEQFWLSYIGALIKEQQSDKARETLELAKKQGVDAGRLNPLERQLSPESQNSNTARVNPPQELLSTLLGHYQSGRFNEAEKLSIKITQDFPKDQFAWKVLGAVLGATGRKSEAMEANQKAITLSPQDAEAHSNLGATLRELGRLDEAEASYTQAIALKPDFAEAHSNLGNTLKELGRLDEAISHYTQASFIDPKNPKFYVLRGLTPSLITRPLLINQDDQIKSINDCDWATSEKFLKQLFAENSTYTGQNVAEFISLWCALCRNLINQRAIEKLIPIFIKLCFLAERNKDVDNLIQVFYENIDIDTVLQLVKPEDSILINLSYCQYNFLRENFSQAEALAIENIQKSVKLIKVKKTEDLGWLVVRRSLALCARKDASKTALSNLISNLVN